MSPRTTTIRTPFLRPLLLLGLLLGLAGPARAVCTLVCSCSVTTTTLAFGSYNPLAFGNTDSSGTVRVQCGGVIGLLIPYEVTMSTGSSGSYAIRKLKFGAHTLDYNLYTDATYTAVLGDGTTGGTQKISSSVTLDLAGLSPPQIHWVYGRLAGRQLGAAPGAYSDSLTATLTYY